MIPAGLFPFLEATRAIIPSVAEELGNPPWEKAETRILILRLSPYRDIERSSSHLVLFSECRPALPGAFIDFGFFPSRADRLLLSSRGLPWFYGLASRRGPEEFDLILISNSFGLELVNLPYLFSTTGLPIRASERSRARRSGGRIPLVILGGSNAAAAGSLLFPREEGLERQDCLVDGLFFGEGETAIGELAAILCHGGIEPEARLEDAARIEGFWPAGSVSPARRRASRRTPPPLVGYPILNGEEASTARLQITAGCPGFCSFCFEGWDRRPYREAGLDELVASARELKAATGAETLELYSFNFNTHAEIFALIFELNRIFRRVNMMSQRLDILATTRSLATAELTADKRSFTLGVEGISARMRAYYRKGLEDCDLGRVLDRLVRPGVRELKLFYILSGIEEAADLDEFSAFAKDLASRRDAGAPSLRILISAGYLVRLPFTPLQFSGLVLDEAPLRRISSRLGSVCEEAGIEFRLSSHFDEYCADQLIVLGGERLGPWLEALPKEGHCFDLSLSKGTWPSLEAFSRSAGLLDGCFLAEKRGDWRPPLAFIEPEEQHALLYEHYVAARAFRDRRLCLGAACSGCGACSDGEERAALRFHATTPPPPDFVDRLGRLLAAKAAFASTYCAVELPDTLAGASESYRESWILRRIFAASPGAEAAVFEARDAFFATGPLGAMLPDYVGHGVFELRGPEPARMAGAAAAAGFEPLAAPPPPPLSVSVELCVSADYADSAEISFRVWLAAGHVELIETRAGGTRTFTASGESERRQTLSSAVFLRGKTGLSIRLELGRKAELAPWIARFAPVRALLIKVLGFDEVPTKA